MDIGDRVKKIRTSVGITQTKFAERIAVSTSYVSEIETKVNNNCIQGNVQSGLLP